MLVKAINQGSLHTDVQESTFEVAHISEHELAMPVKEISALLPTLVE
jgi:hypothetical protein